MVRKIAPARAKTMLRDINNSLNEIIGNAKALSEVIEDFEGEKRLKGEGFSNAKRYFSRVHGEIVFQIKAVAVLLRRKNNDLIELIDSAYLTGRSKLDEGEIERQIDELEEQDRLGSGLNNRSRKSRGGQRIPVRSNNALIAELRGIIDQMKKLDNGSRGIYQDADRELERLEEMIDKVSDKNYVRYDEKSGKFNIIENNWSQNRERLVKIFEDENIDVNAYDPVNMATGNYIYGKEFLKTLGIKRLAFKLIYNSADRYENNAASRGWRHNFTEELIDEGEVISVAVYGGRKEDYILRNGKYESERGNLKRRVEKTEGEGAFKYIYENETGEKSFYDIEGRCIEKEDRDGRRIRLEYKDALLVKVTNEFGAGYEIKYGRNGYIQEVRDFSGRCISLEYDNGNLTCVRDEAGEKYCYEYDDTGRMCAVINARGIRTVENVYDENNRVTLQRFPDGGEISFKYLDSINTVRAIEQNGNTAEYERDDKGRSTRVIYSHSVEEYEYDEHDQRVSFTDRNGNVTSYEYDDEGNKVKEADAEGNIWESIYYKGKETEKKVNGNIIYKVQYGDRGAEKYTDALGRESRIIYDDKKLPVKIIRPDGAEVFICYDERFNICEIRDGGGNTWKYSYDDLGRVIKSQDANGNTERYEYNNRNEIVKHVNGAGYERHCMYNESGKLIYVKDYDDGEEHIEYNELNKVSRYTDKEGGETHYTYNLMHDVESITDALGAVTVFSYDKLRRLRRVTDAKLNSISYEYDRNGNVIKILDEEKKEVKYTYDALNRVKEVSYADGSVERYEHDAFGNVIKYTDAAGGEWKAVYDMAGQKAEEITPSGSVIRYTYDKAGNMVEKDCNGLKSSYTYDNGGRLVKAASAGGLYISFSYDGNGNVIRREEKGIVYDYTYDPLNNLTEVRCNGEFRERYEYDRTGNVISKTDGEGNVTRYEMSKRGEILSVIDPTGHKVSYGYDKAGNLTGIDYGDGKGVHYDRDILGRIIEARDPLGNVTRYRYNGRGEVIGRTDADGFETKIGRNHIGDIESIEYSDGDKAEYAYTPLRKLSRIKDALGITAIEYDRMGRETNVKDHKGREVGYSYDDKGNIKSIMYPDGSEATYSYDDKGLLESITAGGADWKYSYDEYERVISRSSGDVHTEYGYDSFGRLKRLRHMKGGEVLDSFVYGYDRRDSVIRLDKQRKGMEEDSGTFEYGYDPLGRLTSASRNGHLLREYSYDEYGNRISKTENGKRSEYIYDEANQLTGCTIGRDNVSFAYDKRGNMIEKVVNGSRTHSYVYGASGRLTEAVNAKGIKARYRYNGMGHRTERKSDNTDYDCVLDQRRSYAHILSDGTSNIVWDGDSPLAAVCGSEVTHLMQDRLGSTVRSIGRNESIAAFDEFGVDTSNDGAYDGRYGFTGYMKDDVSDTYFAQAREYMPDMGRFAARDILKGNIQTPMSLNEYVYCYNNPTRYVDPDGMQPAEVMEDEEIYETFDHIMDYSMSTGANKITGKGVKGIVNHYTEISAKNTTKQYISMVNEAKITPNAVRSPQSVLREGTTTIKGIRTKGAKFGSALGKVAGGAANVVFDVANGYMEDKSEGVSTSKTRSNMMVNAGASLTTLGVSAGATTALVVIAGLAAGPAGWIGIGVGLIFSLFIKGLVDDVKDQVNSID